MDKLAKTKPITDIATVINKTEPKQEQNKVVQQVQMFFNHSVRPKYVFATIMKQITQKDGEWQATEAIKCRIQDPNPLAVLLYRAMNKVEFCNNRLRKGFQHDFS